MNTLIRSPLLQCLSPIIRHFMHQHTQNKHTQQQLLASSRVDGVPRGCCNATSPLRRVPRVNSKVHLSWVPGSDMQPFLRQAAQAADWLQRQARQARVCAHAGVLRQAPHVRYACCLGTEPHSRQQQAAGVACGLAGRRCSPAWHLVTPARSRTQNTCCSYLSALLSCLLLSLHAQTTAGWRR